MDALKLIQVPGCQKIIFPFNFRNIVRWEKSAAEIQTSYSVMGIQKKGYVIDKVIIRNTKTIIVI